MNISNGQRGIAPARQVVFIIIIIIINSHATHLTGYGRTQNRGEEGKSMQKVIAHKSCDRCYVSHLHVIHVNYVTEWYIVHSIRCTHKKKPERKKNHEIFIKAIQMSLIPPQAFNVQCLDFCARTPLFHRLFVSILDGNVIRYILIFFWHTIVVSSMLFVSAINFT